ncbi:putative protein phosphatase 2C 33 [Platanthera guangdongensis]|uniref:protein-serine/threonine phosphatase n=1 Tax=Platanthera guangdongensis TaxID=2320717 RepID=A0ABR2MX16_9ASPA
MKTLVVILCKTLEEGEYCNPKSIRKEEREKVVEYFTQDDEEVAARERCGWPTVLVLMKGSGGIVGGRILAAAFFCGQPQKPMLLFFKPHRCHSSLSLAPQTKSRPQPGRAFDTSRDAGRLPRRRQERILHPDEIPPPRTDPASRRNRMAWGREDSSPEYIAGGSVVFGDAEGRYSTRRIVKSNCRTFASMYTQQGLKGVNQDAMVLWEDFGGEKGTLFCGVFDGHGPYGHKVAGHVSKNLPSKLSLLLKQPSFPLHHMKLREHLLVANLGDSRAILGTRNEKNMLVPVQLTVDQKPNLPASYLRLPLSRTASKSFFPPEDISPPIRSSSTTAPYSGDLIPLVNPAENRPVPTQAVANNASD